MKPSLRPKALMANLQSEMAPQTGQLSEATV